MLCIININERKRKGERNGTKGKNMSETKVYVKFVCFDLCTEDLEVTIT